MNASRRLAVALVLTMVLSAVPVGLAGATAATPLVGSGTHTLRSAAAPVPLGPSPPSSGAGTFFTTTSVPGVPAAQRSCSGTSCVNASDDPSLNLTSTGVLAAAYTAWSVEAPCAAARAVAVTEIGIVTSTNGGASWSSPAYLGNPDCTSPAVSEFPSAWEPTLTSLANGTLVLAYIEYNLTAGAFPPRIAIGGGAPQVSYDRLVVTRSFNGGSSWSTPTVVNSSSNPTLSSPSYPPERPWITAIGTTVYLAWMNATAEPTSPGTGSSDVWVAASTNGGATFGTPLALPTLANGGTSVAMNPTVAVDGSGHVYVAYTTNVSYDLIAGCPPSGCLYGGWNSTVVVATSTNNATSFSTTQIPGTFLIPPSRWGPFLDPSPQLAVGPGGRQVFVAFSAGQVLSLCSQYGCNTGWGSELFVANSSTSGATFSSAHTVAPALEGGTNFGGNQLYNPGIGVTSDGRLQLTASFDNFSICQVGYYGNFCGPQQQIFTTSSDNGTTFTSPVVVSANWTQLYLDPNNPDGEYATLVTAGTEVYLAWTADICGIWNSSSVFSGCVWPGTGGSSGIQLSTLYQGTGVTMTFQETGLPLGVNWSASVFGNVRAGAAPASLTVSGVPAGLNLTWNISTHSPAGYQFTPVYSTSSPLVVSKAITIWANYTTLVALNITTIPYLPSYPYGAPYCGAGFYWNMVACPGINWNITPAPGVQWVVPGTAVSLDAYPNPVLYCTGTCYNTNILNLSFIAWTGSGSSAVNTTKNATTVTVNGPVTETASFSFDGWCAYTYPTFGAAFYGCVGPNTTYAFEETGLPSGTSWGVTLSSGDQFQSNVTTSRLDAFSSLLSGSLLNYSVWTVPDGSTGKYWVPTSTPVSPIALPADPLVLVNYTLETPSQATFPIYVTSEGLPGGNNWSFSVDSNSYGSSRPSALPVDVSGGTHTFSADRVTYPNGSRYSPQEIDVRVLSSGGGWTNSTSFPASVSIDGAAYVFVNYSVQYLVSATTNGCGNVSSPGGFYAPATPVTLTATPATNCAFVGWTGVGAGGVTASSASITPIVSGPIEELATFSPAPPAVFTVHVNEQGLPVTTAYQVGLGTRSYTGTGSFSISGVAAGPYALSTPYAYLNGTDGVRYVAATVATTFPQASGTLSIAASGWINLTYDEQDLLNVSAGPGGTVAPDGAFWYNAATLVELTATPAAGMEFVGWAGSGPAGASSSVATFSYTVTGPAAEVASFAPRPATPAPAYAITLTESGLPTGLAWGASLNGVGYSTSSSTLTVSLTNGTYALSAGTVLGTPGTRYVPNGTAASVTVTGGPASATVMFSAQYLLTVSSGSGGAVTGGTTGWVGAGSQVVLTATPTNSSWTFVNWTGSGTGAYSGTSPTATITVSGPIAEAAAFGAAPSSVKVTPSSTNPLGGLPIALAVLVVLLIVGVVVAYLVGGRRPPASDAAGGEAPMTEEPMESEAEAAPPASGDDAPSES